MPEDPQDPPRSVALALAPAGSSLELATPAWAVAQRIASTEFVPDAYRGKPETVLAAFLTAHELGVSPMQALQKIHVIKGRPALAAELMRALVLQHGHELWIEESTSTRCIVAGSRKGSDRISKVTWTLDDAKRANLAGKDVWKAYPSAMLLSRASSALCRMIFPDVLAGLSYTPEELEDGDLPELALDYAPAAEAGSVADREANPPPPPARARARRPATRGTSAPADAGAAPPVEKVQREAPLLPGEDEPAAGSDDEVVEAELVDDDPLEDGAGYEGPDENVEREGAGATYTGPQILAMKATDFGLDRDEKLLLCSYIVERPIESTKDLVPDEISSILEIFDDEELLETTWSAAVAAGPIEEPAPEPETTSSGRRPLNGPDSWDADAWRELLRARGVKVAEVIAEANRLAREQGITPPTNLGTVSGSGLADALVGFVEDLAAKRAGT